MKGSIFFVFMMITVNAFAEAISECYADVGFMLDCSGKMKYYNWRKLKEFTRDIILQTDLGQFGTRYGVITYGDNATLNFKLDQYHTRLSIEDGLLAMSYKGGERNMYAAITALNDRLFRPDNGDRPEIPNFAIIVTSGLPAFGGGPTITAAVKAREHGTTINVVELASKFDEKNMNAIASERAFSAHSGYDLEKLGEQFAEEFCRRTKGKVMWFCSFEDEDTQCEFDDDRDGCAHFWRKTSEATRSKGPRSAHHGSHYIHVNPGRQRTKKDKAITYVPFFTTGAKFCLSFYCHMRGRDVGTLEVIISGSNGVKELLSLKGRQHSGWKAKKVTFSLKNEDRIGFRAWHGRGQDGDIALDQLRITLGSC